MSPFRHPSMTILKECFQPKHFTFYLGMIDWIMPVCLNSISSILLPQMLNWYHRLKTPKLQITGLSFRQGQSPPLVIVLATTTNGPPWVTSLSYQMWSEGLTMSNKDSNHLRNYKELEVTSKELGVKLILHNKMMPYGPPSYGLSKLF